VLAPFLARAGFVMLDGGLASELERRGADLTGALWSARVLLDDPGKVHDVHLAYLEAGADVVTTASYQVSVEGFVRAGLSRRDALAALRRSVHLAVDARGRFLESAPTGAGRPRPLVAASVGPFGAALADGSEYRGRYGVGRDRLRDFHLPRLEALIEAGPDLLAIETMPSLGEVELLVRLLEDWPATPVWVSFTCRDAGHLSEGQPVEAVADIASHPQVAAVGVNCVGPSLVEAVLTRVAAVAAIPLVAYPNVGDTWLPAERCWAPSARPFDFASAAPRWRGLGARLIGGCCGTGPETIRAMRAALEPAA
jgi:homocysteine S-methyltransferase